MRSHKEKSNKKYEKEIEDEKNLSTNGNFDHLI